MAGKDLFKKFVFGKTELAEKPLSAREAAQLIARAKDIKRKSTVPSTDRLMEVFSRASAAWADPKYPRRREALHALKIGTGLSEEFLKAVLDEFPKMISPEYLLKKIEGELGYVSIQDEIIPQKNLNLRLIARPAGLVLHVAAGNVFLGCVESLVDGIITKNINFLKMSSADRDFPVIFAESLCEFDRTRVVADRVAVLWWKAGDEEVENLFKRKMDRIVFWGGGEALAGWQRNLGVSTTLVQHGPKISFGVISKNGLESADLPLLAEKIAFDVSVWEQRACNSPQALFVEESAPRERAALFLDHLVSAFNKAASRIPPTERSAGEYVEIIKARELALAKRIMTDAPVRVAGPRTLDWTVICEEKSGKSKLEFSPLNRTIFVKRYSSLHSFAEIVGEHLPYLQTVGYCLGEGEIDGYASFLSRLGATRVCPFGVMAIPTPGAPHDGTYALRDLTRFTVVE